MDKIKIAELDIEYSNLLKKQAELTDSIRLTKESIKELEDAQKKLRDEGKADTQQYERNAKAIEESKTVLTGLNDEYRNNAKVLTSSIAAKNTERGTIQKLEAENANLRLAIKGLNLETEEGRKKQKEYAAQINKNTEFIRANSDAAIQQKMNIGNYKSALDLLPPSLQRGAQGFQVIGNAAKMFMASPLVLAITAIVGALALLFKAFKSTDEGATTLAGVMKAMGNVVDVLLDRVTSLTKLLKDFFTLKWKNLKQDAQDTFGGIKDSIQDAAEAGMEFARTMDDITDGMAADLVTQARMRYEIEKNTIASKDQTKTYAQREAAAKRAMELELELNKKQVDWSKQTTEAELKNLAAKLQNSEMSREQKEAQVREWLALDAKQLDSQRKTNAALGDFYNKNEQAFQKVQGLLAGDIDKATEFYKTTGRLTSALSGFQKTLADEQSKQTEEQLKNMEALEAATKQYETAVVADAIKSLDTLLAGTKESLSAANDEIMQGIQADIEANNTFLDTMQQAIVTDIENEKQLRIMAIEDQMGQRQEALRVQYEEEMAYTNKMGANTLLVEKKYAILRKQLEKEVQMAKYNVIASFAGSLSQLFGEETRIGKAAAIVQTVINTYKGAMSAFAETPGGIVIKSIAAGTAIATGIAAVRNIMKAGKQSSGESGAISDIAGTGMASGQSYTTPQANFVNNISMPQTVLVIEDFQKVQQQQLAVRSAAEL